MKFCRSAEGLYYYKPETVKATIMVNTVEENKETFSPRQQERAKRARTMLHALGCPSIADLKRIIKMNSIVDCPVTIEDIKIAHKIYGPDVPTLKGKTVRDRPEPVVNDVVDIP